MGQILKNNSLPAAAHGAAKTFELLTGIESVWTDWV